MLSRDIRMSHRPNGFPQVSDFEVATSSIGELGENQVLVMNMFLSVDPYQRNRMRFGLRLGEVIPSRALGVVLQSRHTDFNKGDYVLNTGGWRELLLANGFELARLDSEILPIQLHLGLCGIPGLTAYVGLLDHGRPKAGETVFVSSAAGAVGSLAAQIARLTGCRVVGSVGSDQKAAWLRDTVGLDAVINYRTTENFSADIKRNCPEGIDILFEAVGGNDFDTAVGHMRPFGRVVLCGLIGRTNAETRKPGLSNLETILSQRLTIRGFGVNDHLDRMQAFRADIQRWLAEGHLKWRETIVVGIENAPVAFVGLFQGDHFGKTLIRVDNNS